MEGRAYDYNLGRFYGVDPVIQFPTNSQSLNGYSYLMNNPLAGTDPTGYASICDHVSVDCSKVEGGISQNDRNIATADAAWRSAQNQLAAKWNGASQVQSVTPKAQTDGAKNGANGITASPKYDSANAPTLDPIQVTGSNSESRARLQAGRTAEAEAWRAGFEERRDNNAIQAGEIVGMATVTTAACIATAGGCALIGLTSAGAEASYGNYKTAAVVGILSILPVVGPLRTMMREGAVAAEEAPMLKLATEAC